MQAGYDDDPVGALTAALRSALDRPGATWDELLADAGFSPERAAALTRREERALDALFADLTELRVAGP